MININKNIQAKTNKQTNKYKSSSYSTRDLEHITMTFVEIMIKYTPKKIPASSIFIKRKANQDNSHYSWSDGEQTGMLIQFEMKANDEVPTQI